MSDDQDRDGRSAVARGYVLASRATAIGMQMAIPAGLGWWIDSQWKSTPWFTIAGVVLGFLVGMLEVIRLARESNQADPQSRGRSDKRENGEAH